MTVNMKTATDHIFTRVHRQGEEIKNDLPNWVERVVRDEGWKQIIDVTTGQPFESLGKWLTASWPMGPGMGQGRFAITYDEFILLCEKRPTLKNLLVTHRPKGKRGGNGSNQYAKAEVANGDNITLSTSMPKRGTSRAYIEDRLARDFPEHWAKYLAGEYPSARQAAIAAGFLTDTHERGKALKRHWSKASKAERRQFLKSLDEADVKWIRSVVN